MENLRGKINEIIKELHLPNEEFHLVRLTKYKQILISIIEKFTNLEKTNINVWWWDYFNEPIYHFYPKDVFNVLPNIIDNEETVWFVIEDEAKEQEHFWLYEGKINAIISVLKELSCVEYYIVSKNLEWIICENHHDILIGSGNLITEKMKLVNKYVERNVVR